MAGWNLSLSLVAHLGGQAEQTSGLTGGDAVIDDPRRPLFLWSLAKTLKMEFSVVEAWLDPQEAAAGGRAIFLLAAGFIESPATEIRSPYGDRTWIKWPAEDLAARLDHPDVLTLTDDYAPVDRLLKGAARLAE